MTDFVIHGHTFARRVRIQKWEDSQPLVFIDCHFRRGFSARGAKINRGLSFVGCTFEPLKGCPGCEDIGLDFSNARIHGDLLLFNCTVQGRLFASGLKADSNVRLQGCRVAPAGQQLGDAINASRVLEKSIDLQLLKLKWDIFSEQQDASLVIFDRAVIGGHFEICAAGRETARRASAEEWSWDDHASIIAGALTCERIEVAGHITIATLIIFGPATFDACTVTGNFTLRNALLLLRGPGRRDHRLSLRGATIARNLWLIHTEIEGAVSLYGITVGGVSTFGGLHCAGNLDLVFATIGYCAAYRTDDDNLVGRQSLYVGGDLDLSGAKIGMVELRGAIIKRNVTARTGEFGGFTLGIGVEVGRGLGKFWPKPCTVGAVSLTSIQVRENFDLGGIQVDPLYDPTKENRSGVEILNSRIDGALVFFVPEKLDKKLQTRWGAPIANWTNLDPTSPPSKSSPESQEGALKSSEFPSQITGDLIIRACRIGGDLDLRNVQLDRGGIFLNDTTVGLNLKAGSGHESPVIYDLETRCWYLDGAKLSCQGNVDLSGIRVARNLMPGANGKSVPLDDTGAESKESESDTREDLNSEVKKRDVGNVSLHAAHITGDLLLAQGAGSSSDADATMFSGIQKKLDLSAVRCERLVLSANSFYSSAEGAAPRAILARGHFSQVEILHWRRRRIDLRQVAVDHWSFDRENQGGQEGKEGKELANNCVRILKEMKPEDRSIWLSVESDLRNKTYEWQADRVYLAMVRNSMRRRRRRWFFWRPLVFLWHVVVCLAQTCFLWAKAFFIAPLFFTIMTLVGLSILFSNPHNVRATVAYLHALPDEKRVQHPSLEIHPYNVDAEWKSWDAIALALRYHVPLFESRTHDRWEASGSDAKIWTYDLGVRMEIVAFAVEVIYWVMLPILLLGFAAWAFRKRETD